MRFNWEEFYDTGGGPSDGGGPLLVFIACALAALFLWWCL